MLLRNNTLYIREAPINQARDQFRTFGVKEHLRATRSDREAHTTLGFTGNPAKFGKGTCWHNALNLALGQLGQVERTHSQAEAISGGHEEARVAQTHEHSSQYWP